MKKKVLGKKLSRERSSREALFVSLLQSLVKNKKIVTTKAKAKAVAADADKLITVSKKGTLASRRQVVKLLRGDNVGVKTLFEVITPQFANKAGGYTRIVSLVARKGDSAEMARLEWTYENISTKEK